MSFVINKTQRTNFCRVIEALGRLEGNPEQLALDREHRFVDPPPLYPSSGDTTRPPSPGEPLAHDEFARRRDRAQSRPLY